MATRIAGIQPGYLPWLGFFDQMQNVDAFLVADEMPYSTSGWCRRNRVKGPEGAVWLTLPVRSPAATPIDAVRLDPDVPWRRKHAATLRHLYARGCEVEDLVAALETAVAGPAERMVDASIPTLRLIAQRLGITTPILLSSELGLEARYRARYPDRPEPTWRIASYLEDLGARSLLEGAAGRDYFDVPTFRELGFEVTFHDYVHPTYPQLHGAFVSHLSAIDLLLCVGADRAGRVLRGGSA